MVDCHLDHSSMAILRTKQQKVEAWITYIRWVPCFVLQPHDKADRVQVVNPADLLIRGLLQTLSLAGKPKCLHAHNSICGTL